MIFLIGNIVVGFDGKLIAISGHEMQTGKAFGGSGIEFDVQLVVVTTLHGEFGAFIVGEIGRFANPLR